MEIILGNREVRNTSQFYETVITLISESKKYKI